jgi:hypothetical protein
MREHRSFVISVLHFVFFFQNHQYIYIYTSLYCIVMKKINKGIWKTEENAIYIYICHLRRGGGPAGTLHVSVVTIQDSKGYE